MTDADLQQEACDFLMRMAPPGTPATVRIDTHTASVFLVGNAAYKVKRAVKFPFLDYSTLEQRRLACAKELEINRRLCPSVYRAVLPITRDSGGAIALNGASDVVEWVLEMRRFDESKTLDLLVRQGQFKSDDADELGRVVAAVHASAAPADPGQWLSALSRLIAMNSAALSSKPDMFSPELVRSFDHSCRTRLEDTLPILRKRADRGLVRRCHGDLHLANIAMIEGKLSPFDAIEFDEDIATGDVFYDLAFLLMDLVHHGAGDEANIILNRYLGTSNSGADYDGLAALPLFMAIRAAIRAHVTAAKRDRLSDEALATEARRYFELALYLIKPVKPTLVAIGGLSGTGKSRLARSLASAVKPEPGAIVLRSDVERKLLAGVDETDRLPPSSYTVLTSSRVYDQLRTKAAAILAYGHSVIVDAVHATPAERNAVSHTALSAKSAFKGLFLTADLAIRNDRLGNRKNDASDATIETAKMQESYQLGDIDWISLDASGPPESTLRAARAALSLD